MKVRNLWTPIAISLITVACASKEPLVTDLQIEHAKRSGNLNELYESLTVQLADKDPNKFPEEYQKFAEIGSLIAKNQEKKVNIAMARDRLDNNLIPLNLFPQYDTLAAPIEGWDQKRYAVISKTIADAKEATHAAINDKRAQIDEIDKKTHVPEAVRVSEKLPLLLALGELTGNDKYQSQHDEQLKDLESQIQEALETENYDKASKAASVLAAMDPENEQLKKQQVQIDTKLFEQRIVNALAAEDPEQAYEVFVELTTHDNFEKVKPGLRDIGLAMAEYFADTAAQSVEAKRMNAAQRGYSQAQHIQIALGLDPIEFKGQNEFITYMEKGYQNASEQGLHGVAWGYLIAIEGLNPNYAPLSNMNRKTEQAILQSAIKRLSPTTFKTVAGQQDYGDSISSKVTQYLFENLPNDIRIMEREQYEAIQREQSLSEGNGKLSSADFILTGTVEKAKVDSSKNASKRTERVITETEYVTNPEHTAWLALSDGDRKKRPEPAPTVKQEKKEDVTINFAIHRKVGLFAVSYRLIEASTGKILLPRSIKLDKDYEDQESEGVQLGSFSSPHKVAQLPSDNEILDELAENVAKGIGEELKAYLENPEQKYRGESTRYSDAGNFAKAAENLAFALGIEKQKGSDIAVDSKRLSELAIFTGIAAQ